MCVYVQVYVYMHFCVFMYKCIPVWGCVFMCTHAYQRITLHDRLCLPCVSDSISSLNVAHARLVVPKTSKGSLNSTSLLSMKASGLQAHTIMSNFMGSGASNLGPQVYPLSLSQLESLLCQLLSCKGWSSSFCSFLANWWEPSQMDYWPSFTILCVERTCWHFAHW